jgi:hypothetical protein
VECLVCGVQAYDCGRGTDLEDQQKVKLEVDSHWQILSTRNNVVSDVSGG